MSALRFRLSDDIDERLSGESRLVRLALAAAATEADAAELAEEALPFDNESLALAEGRNPAVEMLARDDAS